MNNINFLTRSFLFLLLILTVSSIWGQQNPFEIIGRSSNRVLTDSVIPEEPLQDSAKAMLTIARKSGQKISTILTEQKNALRVDSLNPFEVDHVPIKKLKIQRINQASQELEKGHHAENRFVFWYLLLSCLFLAVILNTRIRLISLTYSSLFNQNLMKLFLRDEGSRSAFYLMLLYAIFWINGATVIYYSLLRIGLAQGHTVWLAVLGLVVALLTVRHTGLYLFGKLFLVSRDAVLYSFTIMVFYLFLGIILIALNILVAFGPEPWHNILLNITLSIFVLFVLIRTIMGFRIISGYFSDRLFQTFLYLCAFEIAPVLILIKSFLNVSESFG